ncbi:adenylate/guanylate cyclase domain-containing protein [Allorhizobium borbori]|uniref:Adenylate cyclase n=1 Tax=Allorhizobium borbori TaxID=485907 RepID=A0A7W6K149_9HYPH|nr:adenylate/guanylate cyclase domain-containing protein [Allorhizobium borbori]MBB4103285.1 adenylate cyclase [Allorhizobium borbori]
MANPVRPFLPDKAARKLGLITGTIMFTFVSMHLLNHALLLVSEDVAGAVLRYFKMIWRNPLGVILLYGALTIHFLLALRLLYLRRSFAWRLVGNIQIISGMLVPLLIAQHVTSARIPVLFKGTDSDYAIVLRAMWANGGMLGVQMVTAIILVWLHGCIGLHGAISHRDWFPRFRQPLFALAIIVPTLALAGIGATAQRLAPSDTPTVDELGSLPDELGGVWLAPAQLYDLQTIERRVYILFALGLGLVIAMRGVRRLFEKEPNIVVTYAHGEQVRVPRGTTILEASHIGRVRHYSVCGGNGRCSTCRVRILESSGPLPKPNALELATLERIQAPSDMRLSCQLRPEYDVVVALQLEPPSGAKPRSDPSALQTGREKEVLILFSDLRNFTTISESRLPYDIVFLLNSYFSILVQAIEGAGGRVDKYLGDGVMAIFGLDDAAPADVCRRALAASAQIIAETRKLNTQLMSEFGIDLEVAIGLHYGPAIVGVVGYGKVATLTAIGDTVNVASRLEGVAKRFNVALAASETVILLSGVAHEEVSPRRMSLKGRRIDMPVMLFSAEQAMRYA